MLLSLDTWGVSFSCIPIILHSSSSLWCSHQWHHKSSFSEFILIADLAVVWAFLGVHIQTVWAQSYKVSSNHTFYSFSHLIPFGQVLMRQKKCWNNEQVTELNVWSPFFIYFLPPSPATLPYWNPNFFPLLTSSHLLSSCALCHACFYFSAFIVSLCPPFSSRSINKQPPLWMLIKLQLRQISACSHLLSSSQARRLHSTLLECCSLSFTYTHKHIHIGSIFLFLWL